MNESCEGLELRSVSKYYTDGERRLSVISDVSFKFSETARVAIIGESGVGKSTLLHILGGLDRPSSGAVYYQGQNIAELNDRELSRYRGTTIGFVFQFHHLLPEFNGV